jgi:hypothetical protein
VYVEPYRPLERVRGGSPILRSVSTQRFPSRRQDGTAEVAAVFREPLDESKSVIDQALAEWHGDLKEVDMSVDLVGEPEVISSVEGLRIVFHIKPDSRLWRDWVVALVGRVSNHFGPSSFVGFFDAVAGRMHSTAKDPNRSTD